MRSESHEEAVAALVEAMKDEARIALLGKKKWRRQIKAGIRRCKAEMADLPPAERLIAKAAIKELRAYLAALRKNKA